ncbi:hypothetical protein, partial [uncultured Eubacterium sp.]|uniref:hypothetical protein n=1 Tax=uncultured Eubacterium sp. TaxID=165185 RepID=UPI0032646B5A
MTKIKNDFTDKQYRYEILLSQAIDEFKKVNKIMGVEFADRLKKVVDEYNNRRRDEAYANEVLDDVAEQLAQLLSELK